MVPPSWDERTGAVEQRTTRDIFQNLVVLSERSISVTKTSFFAMFSVILHVTTSNRQDAHNL